ncbi:MAG: AAA family ATPase [Cyclobacteriaceae bacterium]|nr:AAA family ATPase [Cyclobacteriaceae bacterium]
MHVSKVHIQNFKGFKGSFKVLLNERINIFVGDNEAGKSTIIEGIHLVLSGLFNGRYLRNELSQYVFNVHVVEEYIKKLESGDTPLPPHILIELFLEGADLAEFEGINNSERVKAQGLSLRIAFDEKFQAEYEKLVLAGNIKTIPIEYYGMVLSTFAQDEGITPRTIPLKSALIDSTSSRYQNGSDIYISRIVRELLDEEEVVNISQAHRKMKEGFMNEASIKLINEKIQRSTQISNKKVELSVDLSSKNAWESSLMTYLENVPFHYIGKGEQSIIKTKLALAHKKSKEANFILLEEPENHLSHSKLSELIGYLKADSQGKQIVITTHNSFVANKLGLDSLILLHDQRTIRLNDLSSDTKEFFRKLSGYDTLRLVLCSKAILVEGDSDELVIQKAYLIAKGHLPIEDGIDVISVGTSFMRFLEIAVKLCKKVAVATDNDGNLSAVEKKYRDFIGSNTKPSIKICYDETVDTGSNEKINYNTLEPKLLKANGLTLMNEVLGKTFKSDEELLLYARSNKTECALKIFDFGKELKFPQYLLDAINF